MFVRGRPTDAQLDRVLAEQSSEAVTYPEVGATVRATRPAGYRHDSGQITLGRGDAVFELAVLGLRGWEAHRGAGLTVRPRTAELVEGTTVLVVLALPLLSAVAACRIVSVVDEPDVFGFAYGTLPAHPEQGEEAFLVRREASGSVSFSITAFSRQRPQRVRGRRGRSRLNGRLRRSRSGPRPCRRRAARRHR